MSRRPWKVVILLADERGLGSWQGDSTLFCTDHTVNECSEFDRRGDYRHES